MKRYISWGATLLVTAMLCGSASIPARSAGVPSQISYTDVTKLYGAIPKPAKHYHFAYVTKTLVNEFWVAVAQGIRQEAARYGIQVDVQAAKDESSLTEQLSIGQTMLGSGKYDALLLSPQSGTNMLSVVQAAAAKHIPTVIIDDARTDGANTYVGTDQVMIGKRAAQFLEGHLPKGSEVAMIEGQPGSPNGLKRKIGFTNEITGSHLLKLVASQTGNWDTTQALNVATNIMRAHPNLAGFYSANDGMAFGVIQAVQNAGKTGKILVVGTDGISEAKAKVKAGAESATIAEFPTDEGIMGVDMALRLLGGQKLPVWIISKQALLTPGNIATYLCQPPAAPGCK